MILTKKSLYTKNLSEWKYKFLIEKREVAGIKYFNDSKAFVKCSNTMDYVYRSIDDYNPNRKGKTLIFFDGIISDIMGNKKFKLLWKKSFLDAKIWIFHLNLSHSLIFLFQKMSD